MPAVRPRRKVTKKSPITMPDTAASNDDVSKLSNDDILPSDQRRLPTKRPGN